MYRIIEIEIFSYCNRKCDWCPNRDTNRTIFSYLDKNILHSFLQQLNDYNGVFSFSRYNEPFANFEILEDYIKIIKSYYPDNKLVSNTNGDYINKNILNQMSINELTIMNYDNIPKEEIYEKLRDWGIEQIQDWNNYFTGRIADKTILYYYNWNNITISDRGGSLKEYSQTIRTNPCYEPQYFLGLNYDGTLSPCCNIRSDLHPNYILGDLNKNTLSEILENKEFINNTLTANYNQDMPCYYCNNCGGRYTRDKEGILYE